MKMRTSFFMLACIAISQLAHAQLKTTSTCPPINVDFLDGSVNKMYPESPWGEIQMRLPCFTEAIAEPSASGCAGVFYKDKGINFYTYRDYIEINENFKGTMSLPLMGADHNSLSKWFGIPQTRDMAWESYQMRHGVLVTFFNSTGKIYKIILSNKSAATLRLCD
ncbi:MAG: hypothetical protein H7258_07975 [Ferruginibacter sp.]|nr:hypothetical protein [Ferruginibacter sp.]